MMRLTRSISASMTVDVLPERAGAAELVPQELGRRPGSPRADCGSRGRGRAPSGPARPASRRAGPPPRGLGSATGRARTATAPRRPPLGPWMGAVSTLTGIARPSVVVDLRLRLGAALGQPDGLAQVPDQPGLGAQALRAAAARARGGAERPVSASAAAFQRNTVRSGRTPMTASGRLARSRSTSDRGHRRVTRHASGRVAWALSVRSARSPAASRAGRRRRSWPRCPCRGAEGGAVQR